ncbi:MAG: hypothetical protein D3923_04915 [Candidatus Electrothrix sp. AR3]|nr:hypothetical protein [Candidatus Electrothrix sp. AR3]
MLECVPHEELDKVTENFQMLFESVATDLLAEQLDRGDILIHLAKQTRQHSRYTTANKDRKNKNLAAVWNWISQCLPDFSEANTFLLERLPEAQSNSSVPPKKDFY